MSTGHARGYRHAALDACGITTVFAAKTGASGSAVREVGDVAKGKYEYWLTDDGLILLEGWARDGLTDEQIAHNMGVTVSTLYAWKNKYSEILEALKKGKEVVDYEVENALLQSAMDGNTTAQIFWLKNRKPDKWRDKPQEPTDDKELDRARQLLGGIDSVIKSETD